MKPSHTHFATTLLLLAHFAVAGRAEAQPGSTDSGAVIVGTIRAAISVSNVADRAAAADLTLPLDQAECVVIEEGIVWNTPDGFVIVGQVQTLTTLGSCDSLDSLPTAWLFDQLSSELVEEGIRQGYVSCGGACDTPALVRVNQPACVDVVIRESHEGFEACGDAISYREYSVCCPIDTASPEVVLLQDFCPGCLGEVIHCEPTCSVVDTSTKREALLTIGPVTSISTSRCPMIMGRQCDGWCESQSPSADKCDYALSLGVRHGGRHSQPSPGLRRGSGPDASTGRSALDQPAQPLVNSSARRLIHRSQCGRLRA